MKRWMTALGTLVVTMSRAGCTPVVLDPVQQEPLPDGGIVAPVASTSAIAILAKDLPPSGPKQGMVGGYGFDVDPDALVLMFSDLPQACADPLIGSACPTSFVWQGVVIVPPDLVRVGLVDLANPRIASWTVNILDSVGCYADTVFVPVSSATMEIVSIDAGSITVNLIDGILGSSAPYFNLVLTPVVTVQGTFTVPRCDAAPPPPPPSAAVVLRGAELPAGLPPSATIGATVDPTALYVFLGSGTQTCADPLSSLDCGPARLTLLIPAALQHPGTLDLSDPQLAASIQLSGYTPSCLASTGSFMAGTLTITSVDASGISFSLYKSRTVSPDGSQFDADGLYQATICP